jgi:hypothetical protein
MLGMKFSTTCEYVEFVFIFRKNLALAYNKRKEIVKTDSAQNENI